MFERSEQTLRPQDRVARVDVDRLAGDRAAQVAHQEQGGVAHVFLANVAPQRRAAGATHVTPADDAQLCLGRIASLPNPFTGSPGMAPLARAAKGPKARAARAPASLTPSPERSGSRAGARAAGQRSAREMKEMSVRLAMLASCVCVCVCLCVSVCVCVF